MNMPPASDKRRSVALRLALLLSLPLLFASCSTLAPFRPTGQPEKIPHGCGERWVTLAMGKPDRRCPVEHGGDVVGHVWMYDDYWWSRDGLRHSVGSWDLYFDADRKYVGWRLVEPLSQSAMDTAARLRRVPWVKVDSKRARLHPQVSATTNVRPVKSDR